MMLKDLFTLKACFCLMTNFELLLYSSSDLSLIRKKEIGSIAGIAYNELHDQIYVLQCSRTLFRQWIRI